MGVRPGEVQNVLHEKDQSLRLGVQQVQIPLLLLAPVAPQQLQVQLHGCDGRAQLMGDVGHEARLHAVELLEPGHVVQHHYR